MATPNPGYPTSSSRPNEEERVVFQLVAHLSHEKYRQNAQRLLAERREFYPNLALWLWSSRGAISALLEEVISAYPFLSPPFINKDAANRVGHALALLQCVAAHPETKAPFVSAQIPLYLYPFLETKNKNDAIESLRRSSLGVIGALVKVDNTEVISDLLKAQVVPQCLHCVEHGDETTRLVATFIIQKILFNDVGLQYICGYAPDRFFALVRMLSGTVMSPAEPTPRLMKNIIHCFLRLSDYTRTIEWLKNWIPNLMKDPKFNSCLHEDQSNVVLFQQLMFAVGLLRHPANHQVKFYAELVGARGHRS